MAEPTVSVIVPTFNRARYLPECLDSLLAQTFPPTQIIVVNDGSTDDTASVVKPYLDRIEYIEKENGGKSSALNLVLPRIRNNYVWIFDDDDVALPGALEIHVTALEGNPNIGFTYATCYTGVTGRNGRIQKGALRSLPDIPQDAFFPRLLEGCFLTGQASIFVRTSCYRSVGAFDTRLIRSEDYDMMLRLSRQFKGLGINKPTYIYRLHDSPRGHSGNRIPINRTSYEGYKYDKIIFEKLCKELDLSEYSPIRQRNRLLNCDAKRKALLQRMSVMARKGLWHYAAADLEKLFRDKKLQEPLSEFERQLCRKAMGNRFAVSEMLSKRSFLPTVRKFCQGLIGTEMRYNFARGLYHVAVREFGNANYRLAATTLVSIVQILGVAGTVEAMKFKLRLPSKIR